VTSEQVSPQKKGRPTPTRREVEAANRAKAKVPRTRRERAAARRGSRTDTAAKMREAMRSGDDRYLPERDRGPVKRFIRDYVDSGFSVLEVMLPLMVVLLAFGYVGTRALANFSAGAVPALLLVIIAEALRLRWRVGRELDRRFPGQSHRGATSYAVMRALQVRFMRKPDRKVRLGQTLPDTYR
jgi:Protein of unknown function (DUF3043)